MIKKIIYKKFIQPKDSYFRAGAGVIVLNHKNELAMFERTNQPGAFQFSQGGLDVGEDPRAGAMRELYEETGITEEDCTFVAELSGWHSYLYPEMSVVGKSFRGQTHKWFVVRINSDHKIDLDNAPDHEFVSYKWVDQNKVLDEIIEFKKDMYIKLIDNVQTILDHEKV